MISQLNLSSSTIRIFPISEVLKSSYFSCLLKNEEVPLERAFPELSLIILFGVLSFNGISNGSENSISGTLMSPYLYLSQPLYILMSLIKVEV